MKHASLPPDAPVLLESMRAIGYDASTAIADLVDNSITADATHVSIRFNAGTPEALAIFDNGVGMTYDELRAAMRHGSRNPQDIRSEKDLGRFGLGLKTASMSQCRRLTVLSRKGGALVGMVWDLDEVGHDWMVGVLDEADISRVPYHDLLNDEQHGSLVVWQKLDRLNAGGAGNTAHFSERMRIVGDHLALVFHRYLSSTPHPLRLTINERPVEPLDPFLREHGSLAGQEESIQLEGHHILLRAYTLPHISRLTRKQIEIAGGEIGLRRQQGFYVYRNRRLIVWGTWFRLFRQEELTKLTRVMVDVPNALDHLWSLDIKKSAAMPPPIVRERLRDLVPTLVKPSQDANKYRGHPPASHGIHAMWQRIEERDGVRYAVDTEHPLIASLRGSSGDIEVRDFDNMLRAVADSLPIEAIYNDRSGDSMGHKRHPESSEQLEEYLEDLARQIVSALPAGSPERQKLLGNLEKLEPFAFHTDLIPALRARLA